MSARAAPASMTTRHKAAHRIADRVLFNFLLSLYGRSRLNRNANRRPQCGDRSGGVFRKCSPPRLSPEADGSGGDSSPRGSGWGSFQEALSAASGSKAGGIPAREGRAGEFSGSVIGRVRLESGGFQPERVGLGSFQEALSAASGSKAGGLQPERVGLGEIAEALSAASGSKAGDSSPRGSGWGVFRKRYRPRPARKRGIPARKGRAGGNCGSVICRVRLRRLARRHHRRGLHRSRRRNGCRRRSCRRNDRRSRRWNGCRRNGR